MQTNISLSYVFMIFKHFLIIIFNLLVLSLGRCHRCFLHHFRKDSFRRGWNIDLFLHLYFSLSCFCICTGHLQQIKRIFVTCHCSQFLLYAKELIIFGNTITSAGCPRLDLTGIHRHGKIGNEGVLRFPRSV